MILTLCGSAPFVAQAKAHISAMMTNIETRAGLPDEMQVLLRDLPRDVWPDHPNFAASIRNWMGAHEMFRQLGTITQEDTESFLSNEMEGETYVGRLEHFGNLLVRNLHGHHSWEDRKFFPELEAADDRFSAGLQMLESDHEALDALLDRFTRQANRIVQLHNLDPSQMAEEAKPFRETSVALSRFLTRHLTDEEDLAVPILLHHQLRG